VLIVQLCNSALSDAINENDKQVLNFLEELDVEDNGDQGFKIHFVRSFGFVLNTRNSAPAIHFSRTRHSLSPLSLKIRKPLLSLLPLNGSLAR
jgi:hypothetical protein